MEQPKHDSRNQNAENFTEVLEEIVQEETNQVLKPGTRTNRIKRY